MAGEDDDSFLEEDAGDKNQQNFDEDVDNDEITPGEEGFLQGYDSAEGESEEKPKEPKEEGEEGK